MLGTEIPSKSELVGRAAKLAPVLASHSAWHEENRRLHHETVNAMAEAGVFKMRVPRRYGGYESDARTVLDVISEIGMGDGSAAWNTAVYAMSTWLACLFPDEAQDEVFVTPDVRVCGVLSPSATAEPRDGGFTVNGRWRFISGALHAHWQVIIAMGPAPDGTQWPVMALVPMPDLEIVDDWHTSGLRGTGSVTTVATDLFVPGHRVYPMPLVLQEQFASKANADAAVYRAPMMATGCGTFTGAAIGLAKAGLAGFLERLPERKITYTDYARQAEAPLTHLQVAEASLKIDEAGFHADRLAAKLDAKSAEGEPWSLEERVGARAALGRVFSLTKEAVDVLSTASGGSSIYNTEPVQRILRDLQALNQHALMHPDTNFELYGRILCGQPPNTMYL
ncbi:acyl-CoA dehydrogenase family protein [Actinomadura sp. 1N219]|uniref:acyl-CoA dehydrogenase family protein n=1 Tax=Actinomadura sp. 1N219 TaxID=3375152 RepID=UPI0037959F9F